MLNHFVGQRVNVYQSLNLDLHMLKFKKNSSSSIGSPAGIDMSDKVSNTARQFLPCLQETQSYAIVFLEIA